MEKATFLKKHSIAITASCLIFLVAGMILYKVLALGYGFSTIVPRLTYEVAVKMSFQGFNEPVHIKTFLPISDDRQHISEETNDSPGFLLELFHEKGGRLASWSGENVKGQQQISYSFRVQGEQVVYQIEEDLAVPDSYPDSFQDDLSATPSIQFHHPVIEEVYRRIIPPTENMNQILKAVFDHCLHLKPMPFKGFTDAVTAAKLGEASCNGKSRLFVALARRANIPSRLVGGLILQSSTKRTSHQWAEAYINGFWIPFDPLNNHFARIPENYLVLYRGDRMLFTHSPNINFNNSFKIRKRLAPQSGSIFEQRGDLFNPYKIWGAFAQVGIPLDLLKIIIMLPLGAFIVAIFRNVMGLETFGTFLPALIAAGSREAGFLWGLVGFISIIVLVSLVHYPLEKWGILHTPKMSILMIFVVFVLLGFTMAGVKMKLFHLSYVSLFPIAVLTITAERFALLQVETGLVRAFKVMLMTLIVVAFCYLAMNSLVMETLFLAFPELLLILIVLNLWLGQWIGMRVIELKRFRWFIER